MMTYYSHIRKIDSEWEALEAAKDALRAQQEALPPPCYQPDSDGCAYQIYGDNNDEPIEKCKVCPLCCTDKVRHKQEAEKNEPLTLEELKHMDGQPVWAERPGRSPGWALVQCLWIAKGLIYLVFRNGTEVYAEIFMSNGGKVYRRPPVQEVQHYG